MWEWSPKTDTISYEGKDKEGNPVKANYQRSQLDSQSDAIKKQIDPAFANDQYWLLLPFHVVWDGATVTDEGVQQMPLSGRFAQKIVAKYPDDPRGAEIVQELTAVSPEFTQMWKAQSVARFSSSTVCLCSWTV